jgi:hypothetical protein
VFDPPSLIGPAGVVVSVSSLLQAAKGRASANASTNWLALRVQLFFIGRALSRRRSLSNEIAHYHDNAAALVQQTEATMPFSN